MILYKRLPRQVLRRIRCGYAPPRTPTPTTTWPSYITVPQSYPATTDYYNGGAYVGSSSNSPAANATALLAAIAAAVAGQTILLAPAAVFDPISPPGRALATPIIIRSADVSNKAVFEGKTNGATITIAGWNGIYFRDIVVHAAFLTDEFINIVYFKSGTQNSGILDSVVEGTFNGTTNLGRCIRLESCTSCVVMGNTVQQASYGIITGNDSSSQIIGNDCKSVSADSIHLNGSQTNLVYLNLGQPNFKQGNHPDFIQVTAGSASRSSMNLTFWNCFADCDTSIQKPGSSTISGGRAQGLWLAYEDPVGHPYPTINATVADIKLWGVWFNGANFAGVQNLQFYGTNEVYQIDAEPTPDDITFTQLNVPDDITGSFNDSVTKAYKLSFGGSPSILNPPSQTPNPNPTYKMTNAQRIVAREAWKVEREAYMALLKTA